MSCRDYLIFERERTERRRGTNSRAHRVAIKIVTKYASLQPLAKLLRFIMFSLDRF